MKLRNQSCQLILGHYILIKTKDMIFKWRVIRECKVNCVMLH